MEDYAKIYAALQEADIPLLTHFSETSHQTLLNRPRIASTRETHSHRFLKHLGYNEERRNFHQQNADKALERVVSHRGSDIPPKLILIGGPPGVGKSSARDSLAEQPAFLPDDQTEYALTDPDLLRSRLMKDGEYNGSNAHVGATNEEAFRVSDIIVEKALDNLNSFIAEGSWRNLSWAEWLISTALDKGYDVQLAFVHAPLAECFRRAIAEREDRAVDLKTLLSTAKGYETVAHLIGFVKEHQNTNHAGSVSLTIFDTTRDTPEIIDPLVSPEKFARIQQEVQPLLHAFGRIHI